LVFLFKRVFDGKGFGNIRQVNARPEISPGYCEIVNFEGIDVFKKVYKSPARIAFVGNAPHPFD
jgi:hypothetical protein